MSSKIQAALIIEGIGTPVKKLNEVLESISLKIKEETNIELLSKKLNEAKVLEGKEKGFYTNFVELEVELKDVSTLFYIIFKYMPAHIDIMTPENINMTNNDLNEISNNLTGNLHQYDALARMFKYEKAQLTQALEEAKKGNKK